MTIPAGKTFQLFCLLFVLMFAAIIGDNVSELLLLTFFPAEKLSLMFMANAVSLFLVSVFVLGAIDRIPRFRLFLLILLAETGGLLLIRAGIAFGFAPAYLCLFSFAYVTKILAFLAFWTVANDLCDTREAKRLFPIIGAAGVAGGTLSCFSTAWLAPRAGPENLLFLWVALLAAAVVLLFRLERTFRRELAVIRKPQSQEGGALERLRDNLQVVTGEPLLKTMAVLYFLIFFLLINLDFHFLISLKANLSHLVATQFHDPSRLLIDSPEFKAALSKKLSSFLGLFRGTATAGTFLIQLVLAPWILRKLGTARSMFILPAIFTLAFFLCFLQAAWHLLPVRLEGLVAPFSDTMFFLILAGTAGRIAVFDSLFSPNFQVFFSTLSPQIRGRGKVFMEGVAKPLAILLAGGSILGIVQVVLHRRPDLIWIHFLILFLAGAVLCALVIALQRGYSKSISGSLGEKKAGQVRKVLEMHGWESNTNFLDALQIQLFDEDEDVRIFTLETLAQLNSDRSAALLLKVVKLSNHPNRAEAIRALGRCQELPRHWKELEKLLWEADARITAAILEALGNLPHLQVEHLILPYVKHRDTSAACTAILALWKEGGHLAREDMRRRLEELAHSDGAGSVQAALETMGRLGDPALLPLVKEGADRLAALTPPARAREVRLLALAGFLDPGCWEEILTGLEGCPESLRKKVYSRLGRGLPLLAGRFGAWLKTPAGSLQHHLLELLFLERFPPDKRLRTGLRSLLDAKLAEAQKLQAEIRQLEAGGVDLFPLRQALLEGPFHRLQGDLIHLLGLLDPSAKLFYAAPMLLSRNRFHQAAALEAVETSLSGKLPPLLTPLFQKPDPVSRKPEAAKGSHRPDLTAWRSHPDAWVEACALYCAVAQRRTPPAPGESAELGRLMDFA